MEDVPGMSESDYPKRFNFFTTWSFMINYMVGVGTLAMPYAYSLAGIGFAFLVQISVGLMVVLTLRWVVAASVRAQGILKHIKNGDSEANCTTYLNKVNSEEAGDEDGLILQARAIAQLDASERAMIKAPENDFMTLEEERDHGEMRLLQINELFEVFHPNVKGRRLPIAKWVYEFCIFSLLVLALWSFAGVFGKSFISKFPLLQWGTECASKQKDWSEDCTNSFRISLVGYGLIVVGLTLLEFTEMVWFQVTLTVARFLLFAMMIFSSVIGLWTDRHDNMDPSHHKPYTYDPTVPWFEVNWNSFATALSDSFFGQLIVFGIPDLVQPMAKKAYAGKLVDAGLLATTVFYSLVGGSCAIYFGSKTQDQANLNYQNYTGGSDKPSFIGYVVQYYISLFPAVDVMSMYPLIATSLANSMKAFFYLAMGLEEDNQTKGKKRLINVVCRLSASIPPLLLALLNANLGKIISYAAIPIMYIGMFTPAMLQIFSKRHCIGPVGTAYEPVNALGSDYACYAVIFAAFFSGVVIVLQVAGVITA